MMDKTIFNILPVKQNPKTFGHVKRRDLWEMQSWGKNLVSYNHGGIFIASIIVLILLISEIRDCGKITKKVRWVKKHKRSDRF